MNKRYSLELSCLKAIGSIRLAGECRLTLVLVGWRNGLRRQAQEIETPPQQNRSSSESDRGNDQHNY